MSVDLPGLPDLFGLLGLLRDGVLSVDGRLAVASNLTLLGRVTAGGQTARCVYKPVSGERPLWDFPDGTLAAREVAAYEVSQAAGWQVVPPTVLREDGPFGPGMCQLWVEQPSAGSAAADTRRWVDVVRPDAVAAGWLPILEAVDGAGEPVVLVHADDPALRRLAIFDVVVNNADRKGGHVLAGGGGAAPSWAPVIGVDHGVCFHAEPKLRTVLWGWAGAEITPGERDELIGLRKALEGSLGQRLDALLAPEEVAATAERIDDLLEHGALPDPTGRMPVPWPVF